MSEEPTLDEFVNKDNINTNQENNELYLPEIDSLPEGWNLVTVEEIAEKLIGGGTPSKSMGEYWGGNIPWASVKDLNGIELDETEDYITEVGVENSTTNVVPPNSVIISTRMTVGEPFLNKVKMAINQDMKAIFPDTRKIHPLFLVYSLWDKDSYLKSLGRGTTVDGITTRDLSLTHLGLPGIEEQHQIVGILYNIDKLIKNTQNIIDRLSKVKSATLYDLLSKGYFEHEEWMSVDYQNALMMARAGEIPADWEIREAREVSEIKTGHTPSRSNDEYWGGSIPWVDVEDIRSVEVGIMNTTDEKITKKGLENSGAKLLPKGTLISCRMRAIGVSAILGERMTTNQDFVSFECDRSLIIPEYLMYLLEFATPQLSRLTVGSTHPKIQLSFYPQLKLCLPGVSEQEKIVDVISSIEENIQKERECLDKLIDVKDGLMQDLLSGKVRATNTNIEVPDEIAQYG